MDFLHHDGDFGIGDVVMEPGRYVLFKLKRCPAGGLQFPLPPHFVDLDLQLAQMEEAGIDAVVTSASLIGEVADLELSAATETTAFINEAAASAPVARPVRDGSSRG